jgi:hypothetical protein
MCKGSFVVRYIGNRSLVILMENIIHTCVHWHDVGTHMLECFAYKTILTNRSSDICKDMQMSTGKDIEIIRCYQLEKLLYLLIDPRLYSSLVG